MIKNYEVWLGSKVYHVRAKTTEEAKRNAAHMIKNRGYYPDKSTEELMKMMTAAKY